MNIVAPGFGGGNLSPCRRNPARCTEFLMEREFRVRPATT